MITRGLVWNIITTLFSRVGVLFLSLVSSIILARVLGPEGRGLFALVLLMPELVRTFGLLGFDHANVVYAGLEPQSGQALVWQSGFLSAAVGGAAAIAVMCYIVVGAPGFPELARAPINLYLIALSIVPAALAIECWSAIIRGTNRITLSNIVELGTKLGGLLVLTLLIGWFKLGVFGAVLADFVLNIGTLILLIVILRRANLFGKPTFDWSLCKRTARFAFPAYSATLMSYLNYRVDQFIIAIILPPEQLGFYVIAVALAERLWLLTGAVGNALLPHLTNSKQRDPALSAVVARHVLVWTCAGCVFVFYFADTLVVLLYTSSFAQAVAPLRWLLPGIFVATSGKVLLGELLARKKVSLLVWMTSVAAIVNAVGNVLLIPSMGISGAALASTISYTILSLMITACYLKETAVSLTQLIPRNSDLTSYVALWRQFRNHRPIQSTLSLRTQRSDLK
jgi:O-antigen/teichoic acid export membrane protein